jgi:signal transduction histidine kinase
MEVISQLSSGVAHEFNNILAVIVGYSELITLNLSSDSPVRKYAEEIGHASNRAARLTRQLLVFSRKQLVRLHVIDLNDAVTDVEVLLRRLIEKQRRDCDCSRTNRTCQDRYWPHWASANESSPQRSGCHAQWREAFHRDRERHAR